MNDVSSISLFLFCPSKGIQIEYVLSFSFPDGRWVLSTRDTDSDRGSILWGKCRRESQERAEGCSPQFELVFVERWWCWWWWWWSLVAPPIGTNDSPEGREEWYEGRTNAANKSETRFLLAKFLLDEGRIGKRDFLPTGIKQNNKKIKNEAINNRCVGASEIWKIDD